MKRLYTRPSSIRPLLLRYARCVSALTLLFTPGLLYWGNTSSAAALNPVPTEVLATFTVINTNDSGPGSLRQAIIDANSNPGTDTISFNIPGSGVKTITPSSALPEVTDPVIIDGTTQPGFAGTPVIELSGVLSSANDGILISAGNSTVRGLVINRWAAGIVLITNGTNVIEGNFVGIDATGTSALPNNRDGILIYLGSANNRIGGVAASARNVISGNTRCGVAIQSDNNLVQGNYIGLNAGGTAPLGNGIDGVQLARPNGSVVRGNIISGNANIGIFAFGVASTQIDGNSVGTNASGTAAVANVADGIRFDNVVGSTIGGTSAATRNLVSGNGGAGILLTGNSANNAVLGNYVGTNATGTAAIPNIDIGIVLGDSPNNVIGGTIAGSGNVASGNNQGGIVIRGAAATGNSLLGNLVGLNAQGTGAIGNQTQGIFVYQSPNNIIGGTVAGAGNVVSGNRFANISITEPTATGNQVLGNLVGTNAAGTSAVTGPSSGISVANGASNTDIGTTATGGRNIISGNTGYGIEVSGANTANCRIQGNYIGIGASGTVGLGNNNSGIILDDAHDGLVLGNIISANSDSGVLIQRGSAGNNNSIRGNLIGTNATGTAALGNGFAGVRLTGAPSTIIGGTQAADRNVISGNFAFGMYVSGATATGNSIQGNYIGTDSAGTAAIPNRGEGILITGGANGNTIGGSTFTAGNVISGNSDPSGANGVSLATNNNLIQFNRIGSNAAVNNVIGNIGFGVDVRPDAQNNTIDSNLIVGNGLGGIRMRGTGTGNTMRSNNIFANSVLAPTTGLGIDLGGDGVTLNDPGDADTGPNNLQNFPVLTSAVDSGGNINVRGTLNSIPNTSYRIEFFRTDGCNQTGYGPGQMVLGTATVATDGIGNATINATVPGTLGTGVITSTATRLDAAGGQTDTSEFSKCLAVTAPVSAQNLSLDGSFTASVTDGASNGLVSATQPDGKILVGGSFRFVDGGSRPSLVRLNSDGTVDPTFNPGAIAGDVLAIAVLANGKILIGGSFGYSGVFGLARLNADGSLDTTFNSGGSGANNTGRFVSIAVQSDGKILVAGQSTSGWNGVTNNGVFRLNANGSLDTTYVSGFASPPGLEQVSVQPDGKIFIGGSFNGTYNGATVVCCILRVNPNGTLDSTFQLTANAGYDFALQPDGKIVTNDLVNNTRAVRLNSNGTLDNSFVPPSFAGGFAMDSFALQADGKILGAGEINGQQQSVIRLNSDGSRDTSLDGTSDGYGYDVRVQPDGKIVVAGFFTRIGSNRRNGVARFNADGTLDAAFSPSLTTFGTVNAFVQQPDGKIVAGGKFNLANGAASRNLARFNVDGTIDTTFSIGLGPIQGARSDATVRALATQADGKVLVGGNFGAFDTSSHYLIVRLNANGSVDPTFNLSGDILQEPSGFFTYVEDILVQQDGKVLIGGNVYNGQFVFRGIRRLNSDGSLDTTFNSGGTGANSTVNRILRQADGKLLIGGSFTTYNGTARARVARLNQDGTLDTSFNPGSGANGTVVDVSLQSDGKIVIGGSFTSYNGLSANRIARISTDGTLDNTFNAGAGPNSAVNALSIQDDGKIFAGGTFNGVSSTSINRLARFNPDGTLDTSFSSAFDPANSSGVNALLLQPDSRLYVGGTFSKYAGTTRNGILRLAPGNLFPECIATPIAYGQNYAGVISASSCSVNGNLTNLYNFSGPAGDWVAISLKSTAFVPRMELLDPDGNVMAASGPAVNNTVKVPSQGFLELPTTGTYTIRVIAPPGSAGAYTLSLNENPTGDCTYRLSPEETKATSAGGRFSFDVITQTGCGAIDQPATNGQFYTNASYSNGRVTFTVPQFLGTVDRQEDITVAGQTHRIYQFCTRPAANDDFANAEDVGNDANSPEGTPYSSYNSTATAQQGEPAHAGFAALHSVWYKWTAPLGGLYSFSTSGSSFDTVMAIYACPASGACTFANMTPVGSNDDTTFFDKTSKVNFRAFTGVRYMIAIDGKNGSTGTTSLSWRQYRRLYRVYLQNFNGNQSNFEPDSITASNGQNTVSPTKISQGVYEFDLPADNSVYTVTITGPTGIDWDPNNFVLDSSFRYLDELMNGPLEGGQNTVSNATNSTPRYVLGYVKNIISSDISKLSVVIGNSRGPNPRAPVPCSPLSSTIVNSIPYATYQCITEPQTLHDIIPSMPGKVFVLAIKSYDHPIDNDEFGLPGTAFIASDAPTYNLSGKVLAGGAGTMVTLTYTPAGSTVEIGQQTTTDGAGNYSFPNLLAGKYRVRARHTGFVYSQPADVNLSASTTLDIQALVVCTYTPSTPPVIPLAGGFGDFTITTNDPSCEWTASSGSPSFIVVNSGALAGTGPVHFTVSENTGLARTGTINVAGKTVTIQQLGINPVPAIQSIDWPVRKIGTVPFIMTVKGSGFVETSKVRVNGQDRNTIYVSDTTLRAQIPTTDFPTIGQSQITVFSPTPGGGTSGTLPFRTIARAPVRFDYDGDRKADVSVFRPGSGIWFISGSTAGVSGTQFGAANDKMAPADYDGDGKIDIAMYRPSTGQWFIANSDGTYRTVTFGESTDIPAPGDFDGDGKADIAVYRPANGSWYINRTSAGNLVEQFGLPGDIPAVADYDGDGRDDEAVYRPTSDVPNSGIWYLNRSTDGVLGIRFGFTSDKIAPADYDGDGKTDVAVFRPSNGVWYQFLTATNTFTGLQYGITEDTPVAADYDGDGKADIATFRPSIGSWFIGQSSKGNVVYQFGQQGDRPTPAAYGN